MYKIVTKCIRNHDNIVSVKTYAGQKLKTLTIKINNGQI